MSIERAQTEKDRDARHDEAARLELAVRHRDRTVTENLEEGLLLQARSVEFADAFAAVRDERRG